MFLKLELDHNCCIWFVIRNDYCSSILQQHAYERHVETSVIPSFLKKKEVLLLNYAQWWVSEQASTKMNSFDCFCAFKFFSFFFWLFFGRMAASKRQLTLVSRISFVRISKKKRRIHLTWYAPFTLKTLT